MTPPACSFERADAHLCEGMGQEKQVELLQVSVSQALNEQYLAQQEADSKVCLEMGLISFCACP